ncbi:Integrase-type DNA-binding superfamily protein [Perilla frutescens var. frutescens]|nr:Integrase-type DNA-binding superfamily protein [Perilla frutescens var. frutescens]
MVKNKEENNIQGSRRRGTEGVEAPLARCVKRKRRDAAANVQDGETINPAPMTTIVKRSSRFRGVSKHRWTGRYEAHLWDKLSWNVTQKKKGKQGAYDNEEAAARAYDLAALKYWGTSTFSNFPKADYEKEIQIMQNVTKEEYLATLRRKSSGFSRGVSKYRGVARHHHNGRWEARIGRLFGNKYLYLGTYSTQEEAAHAYDVAAIEYRGINAVTNFDLSSYIPWLKPEANSDHHDSKLCIESQETCRPSSLPTRTFMADNPIKQEVYDTENSSLNSCRKSSSPTALGLLFRSSVFRELVEKNSSLSEEESSDDESTKNLQQRACSNDEYRGLLYGMPFVLSSNGHGKHQLQEQVYSNPEMLGINALRMGSIR